MICYTSNERMRYKIFLKLLIFNLMLYQIYYITYDYLLYPYNVKINVLNDNYIELPSITLCTPKYAIWPTNSIRQLFPEINNEIAFNERLFENCVKNDSMPYTICKSFISIIDSQ